MKEGTWQDFARFDAYLFCATTREMIAAAPSCSRVNQEIDVNDCSPKVWDQIQQAKLDDQVSQLFRGERQWLSLTTPSKRDAERANHRIEMRYLPCKEGPVVLAIVLPFASEQTEIRRDPLTGLFDRAAALHMGQEWLTPASEGVDSFGILFLDLDGFKQINDHHGHATGDQVLCELADRWKRCVRDGDVVARYGGDEFLVLAPGVSSPNEANPIMDRLTACTMEPISTEQGEFHVSATIGVAVARPGASEANLAELISSADKDMYRRKRLRRAQR